MIKFLNIFLFLCLTVNVFGTKADKAHKWHDKDSKYRLSFMLRHKGEPGFWQIGENALPFELAKGFSIYSVDGKKYNFFLNLRTKQMILAAPLKDNTEVFVYPNSKVLDKVKKNRRYYMAGRFFRDWNWWLNQPASQAVNIRILSYEPAPKVVRKVKPKPKPKKKVVRKKVSKKTKKINKTKPVNKVKSKKKVVSKKRPKRRKRPKRLPRVGHLPVKDYPADGADLRKVFKYKPKQYIYRRNYRDTNIIRKMHWRLKGKYVAQLNAKLDLPAPGKYQFAVKTNNMAQLYLGKKCLLKIDSKTASTEKWRETELIELKNNKVELEAYYRGIMDKTHLVIGWRAEGEKAYKFISQKDYVEKHNLEARSLFSKEGRELPLIKYRKAGYFQNPDGKQFLLEFETSNPADNISWQIEEKTVASGKKAMLTFYNKIPHEIACVIDDEPPFKVTIPEDERADPGELLPRDLYIKINAPVLIYDDEILDLTAEYHSELQIDTLAFLTAGSNSKLFEGFDQEHFFPGTGNGPLFRTHEFVKRNFKLKGAEIKSGTELEFSVRTPGGNPGDDYLDFYFDNRRIIFRKLSECGVLHSENSYFVDADGHRIIPILHRPTLADKRKWSLLKSLPVLWGKNGFLVIADDFGKFSSDLSALTTGKGYKLEFADWNLSRHETDIVSAVAAKINLLRDTKADKVLIIPSLYPLKRGVSPRLQQRLLTAMIETARGNKDIREIILTTPFPLPEIFSSNENMKTLLTKVEQLVTEQEIDFLTLPKLTTEKESQVITTYPTGQASVYARMIVEKLCQ